MPDCLQILRRENMAENVDLLDGTLSLVDRSAPMRFDGLRNNCAANCAAPDYRCQGALKRASDRSGSMAHVRYPALPLEQGDT